MHRRTDVIWLIRLLRLPLVFVDAQLLVKALIKLYTIEIRLVGHLQAAGEVSAASNRVPVSESGEGWLRLRKRRRGASHSLYSYLHDVESQ